MERRKYELITTRPRLASMLLEKDYTVESVVNPWNPMKHAWSVTLSDDMAADIADFYNAIDKPLPSVVAAFLKSRKEGEPHE